MSDKEIVIRAKDGDAHAFTILYGKYKKKLYSYAFYRLGNEADAENAVQDCVLSAFEQINKLKRLRLFPRGFSEYYIAAAPLQCKNR